MDRGISKPHTKLSTYASKLWKPNPSLKTVAGEASELLLLLTVHLGLDCHIRMAGFGDSKDTIDPQCLSASQLSSSPSSPLPHTQATLGNKVTTVAPAFQAWRERKNSSWQPGRALRPSWSPSAEVKGRREGRASSTSWG